MYTGTDKPISFTKFKPNVPSPVPVFTVTVNASPDPLMAVMDALLIPVVVNEKFCADNPVTGCAVLTVKKAVAELIFPVVTVFRKLISVCVTSRTVSP